MSQTCKRTPTPSGNLKKYGYHVHIKICSLCGGGREGAERGSLGALPNLLPLQTPATQAKKFTLRSKKPFSEFLKMFLRGASHDINKRHKVSFKVSLFMKNVRNFSKMESNESRRTKDITMTDKFIKGFKECFHFC